MLPQQSVDRYLMLGLPDSESIPRHLSAVEQNMRFAFGVMLKSTNEMEVLLASLRDDDGERELAVREKRTRQTTNEP